MIAVPCLHHGDGMNTSSLKKTPDTITDADIEKIQRLMEWAELIHKDLGEFIGALDRFAMEKKTAGKPPMQDFLTANKKAANQHE